MDTPSVGRAYKLAVTALILFVLGLQLRAIAAPREDWPFGSNYMFAYDVAHGSPLYSIVFFLEDERGESREFRASRDLGIGELAFKRKFFSDYYGSADPRFPQGPRADDSPAKFQERIRRFLALVSGILSRRGVSHHALRVETHQLVDGQVVQRKVIARRLTGDPAP